MRVASSSAVGVVTSAMKHYADDVVAGRDPSAGPSEREDLLTIPNWPYAQLARDWGGVGYVATTVAEFRAALLDVIAAFAHVARPADQGGMQVLARVKLIVIINRRESSYVRSHCIESLTHFHCLRPVIVIDHTQPGPTNLPTERIAQNQQLHQRQHQRHDHQYR